MEDDEERFISGIYNYCDRWCERCPFTDRCRVYYDERRRWERHLLRGEDPDDPEVFMQDVKDSLGEAFRMLEQMSAEMGVSAEPPPAPAPRRRSLREQTHPLFKRAERWSERIGALLERVRADLPGIGEELAGRAEELSDQQQDETLRALEGLRDAYEVLIHYRFLIPVKTARATGREPDEEADPELARYRMSDAVGTAKLVHECLGKSAAALWCVGEFRREWQDEALPLAAETEALRHAIDETFPDHRTFHRPGLDDPPT